MLVICVILIPVIFKECDLRLTRKVTKTNVIRFYSEAGIAVCDKGVIVLIQYATGFYL